MAYLIIFLSSRVANYFTICETIILYISYRHLIKICIFVIFIVKDEINKVIYENIFKVYTTSANMHFTKMFTIIKGYKQ